MQCLVQDCCKGIGRQTQNDPTVINESQSAFVFGRAIIDNIIAAFEIIHHMKRKGRDRWGDVALQIDISKAYDRIRWDYLELMMSKIGFAPRWIRWIMMCVSIVMYKVAINGSLVGPMTPSWGIR